MRKFGFILVLQIFVVFLFAALMAVEAKALCVSSKRANLRVSPSTSAAKTWNVVRYMPLRRVGGKKGWSQVQDVDGDKHWVYNRLVTKKIKCAVIKTKRANLRTAPGGKIHPKYSSAEKYVTFRFVKQKGGWAQVQDEDGSKYWVARKLIWVQ